MTDWAKWVASNPQRVAGALRKNQQAREAGEVPQSVLMQVIPCPAPRQSRRDAWNPRPCVIRYRAFCDAVRSAWPAGIKFPEEGAHITFWMPMPKSWSQKKKLRMMGQPHRQRPDVDNLQKAFIDALHQDDAHIHDIRVSKRWALNGQIGVTL